MTPQEIFDTVVRHLYAQGEQAVTAYGACRYRTRTGLKCAVGCLIADEDYQESMEGNLSVLLAHYTNKPSIAALVQHYYLLADLQLAHDSDENWASPERMRHDLRRVAEQHKLSYAIVDEVAKQ